MRVIPGEDPGSSVHRCLLQMLAVGNGSRLKAGMTNLKASSRQRKNDHDDLDLFICPSFRSCR